MAHREDATAKGVRTPRFAWPRREASIFFLAYGPQPGGPTDKLCGEDTLLRPSEEPNEAMADRGPDGRMVPTNRWRTKTPTDRDAMGSHASRIVRPSHS